MTYNTKTRKEKILRKWYSIISFHLYVVNYNGNIEP